jgi:hypothetical protein
VDAKSVIVGATWFNVSLVEQDNITVPYDFSDEKCRLIVEIDYPYPNKTPNIYGAQLEYPREVASTDDTEKADIITKALDLNMYISESPSNSTIDCSIKNPEATGIEAITYGQKKPVKMTELLTGALFWEGVADEPSWEDTWNPEAELVQFQIRDKWALLEEYIYRDPKCFDGMFFDMFIEDVLTDAGEEVSNVEVESDGFRIPYLPQNGNNFNLIAERGESAARVLQKGIETYAPNWIYGYRPSGGTMKFFGGTPEWYGLDPVHKFFWSLEEAQAELPPGTIFRENVYQSYFAQPLPLEANYIKITGIDLNSGQPIEVSKRDTSSMDPTILPSLRPNNWIGFVRPYGLYHPGITSISVAEQVCIKLYDRLTKLYMVAEWTSQMAIKSNGDPVWRGDKVTLSQHGDFRVTSARARFRKVRSEGKAATDSFVSVPVRYTGIQEVTP